MPPRHTLRKQTESPDAARIRATRDMLARGESGGGGEGSAADGAGVAEGQRVVEGLEQVVVPAEVEDCGGCAFGGAAAVYSEAVGGAGGEGEEGEDEEGAGAS